MIELRYKPDFPDVLRRFEAWWRCQIVDRPPVSIHVHSHRKADRPRRQHSSLRERWFDVEHAIEQVEASMESSIFLAETFPRYEPSLGPEICATVFGCELEFGEGTSWSIPRAKSCRDILKLRPNLDNPYWNNIRAKTDLSLRRGQGLWITALPDLHTNGDLLASLRDPQELCLDLADDLDSVRAACEHVTRAYALMYEDLWDRIRPTGQPCTTWAPYLHDGKAYVTNCDFICMISPRMFRETILPSIVWEMNYLDRNIFHLDGPGALKHLDALLAEKKLDGLQWVYGAGHEPAARWIDVYKKAQAAGKCLQVLTVDMNDAKAVAEQLRPEGVWLCVGGGYELDEAQAFLKWVERWSAGRKA
jgi:hypothetical protein